jgi:hypothetical protein
MVHSSMVSSSVLPWSCAVTDTMRRTFQEGYLSRRLLVFTDHQASFYCQTTSSMEGLGGHNPSEAEQLHRCHPVPVSIFDPFMVIRQALKGDWDHLASMIQQYSIRQHTNADDALSAFLGVMNDLRRSRPRVLSLYGLPLYRLPIGQCDESLGSSLSAGLSWSLHGHKKGDSIKHRPLFPSWTWVGWQGSVNCMCNDSTCIEYMNFIERPRLDQKTGESLELPARWSYTHQQNLHPPTERAACARHRNHRSVQCTSHTRRIHILRRRGRT